jgi:hypothetical protein
MPRTLSLLVVLVVSPVAVAAPPDFDTQIAPLLASHCTDCHSGPKPKGKLDLTRKAGAERSIAAGKPNDSELYARVAAGEMPPKKPLAADEQKLLKEWIEAGAKWGTDPIDPFAITTKTRAGYDWWSLQQVKRPPVPAGANAIDHFVRAKLKDNGLSLSPEADKRTLIRRLYFDLIGLPPTPEEVAAFEKDTRANAYELLVDKLLASPHYGERWARHWLDVVRFGESDGFERNAPRPTAWHYRDWVIRALNADMPFDKFARLQLAGDVLAPNDADAVRATGFLVAGVHNTVLGNDQMRAIARQDELEDIVGGVAQTFLGLTANCARCHDHKFDPISQRDFYSLASALGGVGFGERSLPSAQHAEAVTKAEAKVKAARDALEALEAPARAAALKAKGAKEVARAPAPVAAWDFRKSGDDLVGKLHAKPIGGAKLTADGATFDGKTGFFRTAPLAFDLRAKTLEAWVKLDSLTQRGGGVMTVQTPDGSEFDAIVFGENEPAKWMAGSNNFARYKSFGGTAETSAAKEFVHFAVTFADDGTITGFRDGTPYGKGYASKGPAGFAAGKAVVAFGVRHEPAGGNRMLAGTVGVARLYDKALSREEVAASFAAGSTFASDAEIDAQLSAEDRAKRAKLRAERDSALKALAFVRGLTLNTKAYTNVPVAPGVTKLLYRGDLATPGPVVSPAGVAAVRAANPDFALKPDAPDAERRTKLAEWITSPQNPLFARVIVNRVWHYHFGTGIVDTPNDFGFNGGRPSHPELLDWLASEFVEGKYSLKALHKLIVTSATYKQASALRKEASAKDAENRLLWRYKPRRLEGEAVRDAMLSVSGLLNPEVGGRGFSDYRERNFNGTAYFEPFDPVGPDFHRRSVYRFAPRGANQGLLDTFDCPDPAAAAPRRASTTTPLQALALWNNGFALRAADAFAARAAKGVEGAEAQARAAWRLALQRDPTADELKIATKLVADHGLKALCRVLFNGNEFVVVD